MLIYERILVQLLSNSKIIRNGIDSFQRKMIRRLKKVHWPDIMRNEECDSIKLLVHLDVRQRRLRMLGHLPQ